MLSKLLNLFQRSRETPAETQQTDADPDRSPLQTLAFDKHLLVEIEFLAREDNISVQEAAHNLLHRALYERRESDGWLAVWQSLTPREKETAAYICMGYSNQEIGEHMVISQNTVKTHVRNVLSRFKVNSKIELRRLLSSWDFTEWLEHLFQF
ncbi:MAG: helix-turn-helix transcriptional regulator [Chloroflexota bacterium]